MDYYQRASRFETAINVILGACVALFFIIVAFRLQAFHKRNPPGDSIAARRTKCLRCTYTFFFEVANVWGAVMTYGLFFWSAWWFAYYKMATGVRLLLPSMEFDEAEYRRFLIFFYMTLALKTIAVILQIIEQSRADVFIMDWETLTGAGNDNRKKQSNSEEFDVYGEDSGPIAWRSIFVANELNELQTEMRKIPPATTLIWFTAFYIGLGWQWIAKANPEFTETENPLEPFNPFLKFFLS